MRFFRCTKRVRIESVGIAPGQDGPAETIALVRQAGEACLAGSAQPRETIDLVIHTGVYRSEFLSEPAVAAIAAGELAINADEEVPAERRALAFDLLNGAAGTLTACFVAGQLIAAGRFARALVLASEIDPNRTAWPENRLGIQETASALVLEVGDGPEGFAAFGFRSFPEYVDAIASHTVTHAGRPAVFQHRDPGIDGRIQTCVRDTVVEFLERQGLRIADLKGVILPRQSGLAESLALAPEQVLALPGSQDAFTSTLAYGFTALRGNDRLRSGDAVLVVEIAGGLEVCCALYYA